MDRRFRHERELLTRGSTLQLLHRYVDGVTVRVVRGRDDCIRPWDNSDMKMLLCPISSFIYICFSLVVRAARSSTHCRNRSSNIVNG